MNTSISNRREAPAPARAGRRAAAPRAARVAARAAASAPPPAWPRRVPVPEVKPREPSEPAKKFSLLGSTGSIGTQTLSICEEFPEQFEVVSLSAGRNVDLLAEQVAKFKPLVVSVQGEEDVDRLRSALEARGVGTGVGPAAPEILWGASGIDAVATCEGAEACVTGIVGCAGLRPTAAAIRAGLDVCLANKETLIAGGPAILPMAREAGVKILPADSEHSAIFQCLQGLPEGGLRRIILTASGGAFRDWTKEALANATVRDALRHPNWSMGKKITVDSATLMNKGLEVIEAHYLFGCDYDEIEVLVHAQSIVHSMIETSDSSVLAQLGIPDMRLPLLVTMAWPRRASCPNEASWPRLDLARAKDLTFVEPDLEKYPALRLAYEAGRRGGTQTGVLSAANERAVELFLDERIRYVDIARVVEAVCDAHVADHLDAPSLEQIVQADLWARSKASEVAGKSDVVVA